MMDFFTATIAAILTGFIVGAALNYTLERNIK